MPLMKQPNIVAADHFRNWIHASVRHQTLENMKLYSHFKCLNAGEKNELVPVDTSIIHHAFYRHRSASIAFRQKTAVSSWPRYSGRPRRERLLFPKSPPSLTSKQVRPDLQLTQRRGHADQGQADRSLAGEQVAGAELRGHSSTVPNHLWHGTTPLTSSPRAHC